MRLAARFVIGADGEQPGVLALRSGVGLERDRGQAGDFREPFFQLGEKGLVTARLVGRREGMNPADRGHETGNISAVALSFIVHEPSGIIEVQRRQVARFEPRM
jgi:hypothetical protein